MPSLGWLGEAYWKGPVQVPFLWDGPGYLIMFVDNQNQVKEYSETNNFKAVPITCVTQRPDLVSTAFTAGTSLAGSPSTLRVTIKNQGSVSSAAFKIRYHCSLDTRITSADPVVGSFSVPGLGAGKSTALQHKVTIPSTHHLGLAWMGVVLDYDNKVDERSEGNNTRVDLYWCYRTPQHYRKYTFKGRTNDEYGAAVADAGDVDADGYDDVVVGAPQAELQNTAGEGVVRVYSGRTGGVIRTFAGGTWADHLGVSVAGAGDVNGDGYDDIIAGAISSYGNGYARVYSGKDSKLLKQLIGKSSAHKCGRSVTGLGDVTGDGYDDLAVGTDTENYVRCFSGKTLVAYLQLNGTGRFGYSIAGTGDVDGDGFGDLVIGAPDYAGGGRAYIYNPRTSKVIRTLTPPAGTYAGAKFGWSVAAAGDFNKDGTRDVVVGAYADRKFGTDTGVAHVMSGKDGTVLGSLYGNTGGDRMGYSVAGGGDLNGDGYDDILAGAPNADMTSAVSGGVMALSGKDKRILISLVEPSSKEFGRSVCLIRDMNNDGLPDLAIGAPRESMVGYVRVYHTANKPVGRWRDYGVGCPSSLGWLGRASLGANPNIGKATAIQLRSAPPSAAVLFNLGFQPAKIDFGALGAPGCHGLVQPLFQVLLTSTSQGTVSVPLVVPSNSSLVNTTGYIQWWMRDIKRNPLGMVVSDGIKLTVGKL
ncbi:MAG: FG-GAP-like repeat-containing protein [Planctomycetota bacterium]